MGDKPPGGSRCPAGRGISRAVQPNSKFEVEPNVSNHFAWIRTMLGLSVAPDGGAVTLDPLLPDGVNRFEASSLRVGTGSIDVRIERKGGRARVTDLRATGVSATAV